MKEGAIFCRDCKHIKLANPLIYWGKHRLVYARCFSPRQTSGEGLVHPVLEQGSFCGLNRRDEGKCGSDAKWYEPNE